MSVSPPPSRRARRSKKAAASAFRGDDAEANVGSLPGFERADEACETSRPEDPTGVFDEDAAAAALAFASIDVPPGLGPRNDAATPDLFAEDDSSSGVGRTGGGSTVGSAGRGEAGTTRVVAVVAAAAFAFPSRPVDPLAAAAFAKDFAAGSRGDVSEALPGVDRARAVASTRAFVVVVVGGGDEDVAAGLFDGDAPDDPPLAIVAAIEPRPLDGTGPASDVGPPLAFAGVRLPGCAADGCPVGRTVCGEGRRVPDA